MISKQQSVAQGEVAQRFGALITDDSILEMFAIGRNQSTSKSM